MDNSFPMRLVVTQGDIDQSELGCDVNNPIANALRRSLPSYSYPRAEEEYATVAVPGDERVVASLAGRPGQLLQRFNKGEDVHPTWFKLHFRELGENPAWRGYQFPLC